MNEKRNKFASLALVMTLVACAPEAVPDQRLRDGNILNVPMRVVGKYVGTMVRDTAEERTYYVKLATGPTFIDVEVNQMTYNRTRNWDCILGQVRQFDSKTYFRYNGTIDQNACRIIIDEQQSRNGNAVRTDNTF